MKRVCWTLIGRDHPTQSFRKLFLVVGGRLERPHSVGASTRHLGSGSFALLREVDKFGAVRRSEAAYEPVIFPGEAWRRLPPARVEFSHRSTLLDALTSRSAHGPAEHR